ncbi:MAG: PRC-barrel domain-containing protein [Patescibacteria group bacterium]
MRMSAKQLVGLATYTQAGDHLGKVSDIVIDPETHTVQQYAIRSHDLIGELLQRDLLVSADQVISISEEKMVVEDAVVAERDQKKQPERKPIPAA